MSDTPTLGNINLIAINVGNTRTALAACVDGRMHAAAYAGHDDVDALRAAIGSAWAPFEQRGDTHVPVVIGSVHEARAKRVADLITEREQLEVGWIEREINAAVGRQLDRESLVGADRLLNAAAAYHSVKQACAIVDAGTAVTVDFVDGAGTFHGGAILPGARVQLRALAEQTAQLPALEFTAPDEPIGHSTAQAMYTGVYHGLRGAVRELIEKFAESTGGYPRILATGGDAHTLFDDYDLIETIVDDLTLRGIAVSFHHATEAEQGEQTGDD